MKSRNNLEKLRGKHGLTVTELAKRIGVSKQSLSLNEKKRVNIKTAKKVAEVLNENVFDILGSDVLVLLPETEQDKEIIINMIKEL